MKIRCIADEHTVRGFRLAGVEGQVVSTPSQAQQAVLRAAASPDIGLILITRQISRQIGDVVSRISLQQDRPVILAIPGPEGPQPGDTSLRDLVQTAVGVSVQEDPP